MIIFGGAAGFTPDQIRQMFIQDFNAVAEGFNLASGGKRTASACTDEELIALGIEV